MLQHAGVRFLITGRSKSGSNRVEKGAHNGTIEWSGMCRGLRPYCLGFAEDTAGNQRTYLKEAGHALSLWRNCTNWTDERVDESLPAPALPGAIRHQSGARCGQT